MEGDGEREGTNVSLVDDSGDVCDRLVCCCN